MIFGAAGFVGRNIVEAVKDAGIDFLACDIMNSPWGEDIPYKKIDITDRDAVFSVVEGFDYLFHLSAHPLPASIKEPSLNAKVNILGSLNILDAARETDAKKVIFSSASSLIGDVLQNPVIEEHLCLPKTPYGVAKRSIEHYLRVYNELYGLNYLVFRFFNIYGPYQWPESGALIPTVMSKIINGEEVTIFGDGSIARDFIYVGDVTDFYIQSIKKNIKNEIFNMGTGGLTTIKEIVDAIAKVVGKAPNIIEKPARLGEIANFSADVGKLNNFFGKAPNTPLEEGLKRTYEWLKEEI